MKFSDFAACYGLSSPKAKPVEDPDVLDPARRSGPTAQRVDMSSTTTSSSTGSSTPTRPAWRPALDAISENASALLPAAKHEPIRKGNKVINCRDETRSSTAAGQVMKVVPRSTINRSVSHDTSYTGRKSSSIIMAVPSFYPSPVMF